MVGLDPQTVVLATLGVSLVLFVTDAMRYDAVAVLVVVVLGITGVLTPTEAFAGFASPAVVLVASMYTFAAAISRTGVTEWIGEKVLGGEAGGEATLVFRVVVVSGLLSSVLSNAAVVATLIPVLGAVARRSRIPVSRLLMPLSFGSLTGGLLTVIGTSKNIAVNGVIEQHGHPAFGLFDFSIFGLMLLVVCAVYFLGPGRLLLPRSRVEESLSEHYQVPKFVTEVLVEPTSNLINRAVGDIDVFDRYGIALLGMVRSQGEATVLAPGPYNRIRTDDVLILQGEPDAIMRMRSDLSLRERENAGTGNVRIVAGDVHLVEAVVPATSSLVGQRIKDADFRATTGLNVLAISKHGDVQPSQISETRLEVGDTLLIQGHARDLKRVAQQRNLIVLGEHRAPAVGRTAWQTLGLLAAVLASSAMGGVSLSVAALAGALGLVLLHCLRPDDVRRGIDWSVLILIGGMLALGEAFDKHGLGHAVAEWMRTSSGAMGNPTVVVGALMLITMTLTQLINHVAAAVIMTPVALSLAAELGASDRPLLMAVLTGASCAFMSPVAHQANAMIMGPGDYRYRDFLRVGTPLTVLLLAASTLLIPVLWPF